MRSHVLQMTIESWYQIAYSACHSDPAKTSPYTSGAGASSKASKALIGAMPEPSSAQFAEKVCLLEEVVAGHLEFLFPLSWIKDVKFGEMIAATLPHVRLIPEEKASLESAAFYPLTLQYQRWSPGSSHWAAAFHRTIPGTAVSAPPPPARKLGLTAP